MNTHAQRVEALVAAFIASGQTVLTSLEPEDLDVMFALAEEVVRFSDDRALAAHRARTEEPQP